MLNKNYKILILVFATILVLSLGANFIFLKKGNSGNNLKSDGTFWGASADKNGEAREEFSAKEIYSLFECPCCGKAINECGCPMAKERKSYVDAIIEVGNPKTKNEVIFAYVKKYGLNSFIDREKREEFRQKLTERAPADRPIISLTPEAYDFGNVSRRKGVVTTFFELKNEGKSDLVIDRLETSCGCTSAAIIYQGEEGPRFTMPGHGINEEVKDWKVVIAPGEKAELKVYYDPNVHPDFRGAAVREIYIFSNDPVDFQKKVSIELNQTD